MNWYLINQRGPTGPVSEAEVAERIADGRAGEDTLIRREDELFWRPLSHTPIGRALIKPPPSYPGSTSHCRAYLFLHGLIRKRTGRKLPSFSSKDSG